MGTLERFTRRNRPDDPQVYVAGAGGCVYTYTMGTEGWVLRAEGFLSDRWSAVTYEAQDAGGTTDILIMSNEKDGMIVVYGSDLRVERKTLTIGDAYESVRFAQLGWYAERIFGVGAPGYPDSIFYSRPYSPFDWTDVPQTPEIGGGVINKPTWDGDSFLALCGYGGYLLAIKERTIFEIRGTDPSSFTITEACGTDCPIQARTICTDGLRMLYLSQQGIGLYDGSQARLLARDALEKTLRLRDARMADKATACVCGHVYYLALCLKEDAEDEPQENNAVVEYDLERGTFMLRRGLRVKDFYADGGAVYFTQADAPYQVMRYADPDGGGSQRMDCLWETAWLDLGKTMRKRDFVLHFTAEADSEDQALEISIRTERGEKKRAVMLGRRRRDYRVKIQHSGVRVKLILRATVYGAGGFRIVGGVRVDYTMDEV